MDNNQNYNYGYNQPSVESPKASQSSFNSKIVLIILGIVILIVGIFFAYRFLFQKKSDKFQKEPAFFLQKGDNYALFNEEGKKLTDFVFSYTSKVVNGSALVEKDSQYGIISSSGKMIVNFNKYAYIRSYNGLYIANKDEKNYLLNANGKVLAHADTLSLNTFIGLDGYYMLEEENKFSILNVEGKKIFTFDKGKSTSDPAVTGEAGYMSVSYENQTYILNLKTEKKVASFQAEDPFCINQVKNDGKYISLNSCNGIFSTKKAIYKLVVDGKVIDIDKECDSVYLNTDQILCQKDNKNYLFDNNYKKSITIEKKVYLDYQNYAMVKDSNSVDFYNNGKLVKNVPCRNLDQVEAVDHNYVLLKTYNSKSCGTEYGNYEYYRLNGEKAFDKSYKSVARFDKNGLARVSEDKVHYYMIDDQGKQVGDAFNNILLDTDYYITTKDQKKGIMDKVGTQVVPCSYKEADVMEIQNHKYALLTTTDSKYVVYDLASKKEIVTLSQKPTLNDNYIFVQKDKKQYYSYVNGKLFYEE